MTDAIPTVVLARAGAARDRVVDGLAEAGATLVAILDPSHHAPEALAALAPSALVVVLDPADGDALEPFEPAFATSARTVIFEEAALVLERSGWDAARWVRHLAAKLRGGGGDVLPPAASDAAETPDTPEAPEALDAPDAAPPPGPAPAVAAAAHPAFDPVAAEFDAAPSGQMPAMAFSLDVEPADHDATDHPPTPASPSTPPRDLSDLSDLHARIAGLSLTDTDSYGHGPIKGVVLIAGGLGGPDAVRQLLGALPDGFPRPLLVRLQLDGGRYDRLVRQMERVTTMPVQLAEAGMTVSPGEVYFLPPDLLPSAAGGTLRFAATGDIAGLVDAVPVDDSAVLFLSGADPALVDVVLGPAWQGALVGGQRDDGCYDPTAARAVAQRGGRSGSPADIADWLIARWMPSARRFDSGGWSL